MSLIAALTAVGTGVTFGVATGTTAAVLGGITVGGTVGAGVGAIKAAASGEDVGKGALMGGVGGAVTGGIAPGLGAAVAAPLVSAVGAPATGALIGGVAGAAGGAASSAAGGQDVGKGAMIGGAAGAVGGGLSAAAGPAPIAGTPATAGTPLPAQAPTPTLTEIGTNIPGGAGNTTGAAVIAPVTPTPDSGGTLSGLADSVASGINKAGIPITGAQLSSGLTGLAGAAATDYAGHSMVKANEAAKKAAGEDAIRADEFTNQNQAGMANLRGLGFGSPSGPLSALSGIGRATGGLTALAHGGQVPLKDGAYIIPADVVSALGNGSSKAGAEFLRHLMMEVRKEAVGRQGIGAAKKHVA
jgi:hypothetical protein